MSIEATLGQLERKSLPGTVLYPPSWIDRLFDWVRQGPVPSWLFYLGLWLGQSLLFTGLIFWLGDSQWPPIFDVYLGLGIGLYTTYYLALMHYLDRLAGEALATFRPLLKVSDEKFAALHYELTTLPASGTRVAGILALLVTLVTLPLLPRQSSQSEIAPPLMALAIAVTFTANFLIGIFVYHSIRQLRMVSRIHATVTQVNLFRREPLYAFSVLTSRTGMGLLLAATFGFTPSSVPGLANETFSFYSISLFVGLAIGAFVWPLLGIHQLLAQEKGRLLDETNLRLEAAFAELHNRVDSGTLDDMSGLKASVDSLLIERDVLAKMPTWPWRAGALTGFLSAVLLPVTIWLVQQLLSRLTLP